MTAKEYLSGLLDIRGTVKKYEMKAQEIRCRIESPNRAVIEAASVQHSRNADKMADNMILLEKAEAKKLKAFIAYLEKWQEVEEMIFSLPPGLPAMVLEERYLTGGTFAEIAKRLNTSEMCAIQSHAKGLKLFSELYGFPK